MASQEVNSVVTRRFWDLFDALPPDVQKLAVKNYSLWQRDLAILRFISAGSRAARIAAAFALAYLISQRHNAKHSDALKIGVATHESATDGESGCAIHRSFSSSERPKLCWASLTVA